MAEVAPEKPLSLAEQYSLQDSKKVDQIGTSVEKAPENEIPANVCSGSVAEKTDKTPIAEEDRATEETYNESTQEQESEIQEDEEKPEIKLETAPADFRFPTTNQTRHCFTRYIEYHRCVAAKGEDVPECNKFAKFYRSLCPSEWVERWNEQRGNGTFPGPL